MTTFETLVVSKDGPVARVAFNRSETLNAMNTVMRQELLAAARQLNLDDNIRVVELTGEGRAFGAGADLAVLKDIIQHFIQVNKAVRPTK